MWKLNVLSQEKIIDHQQEVSTVKGVHFYVANEDAADAPEQKTVPGFTAYDAEGRAIESIGGHESSMELSEEGYVCIRGLWVHRREALVGPRLYYGVMAEDGTFTDARELEQQWSDPRLLREWQLEPSMSGEELLASGQAAGYAGTD